MKITTKTKRNPNLGGRKSWSTWESSLTRLPRRREIREAAALSDGMNGCTTIDRTPWSSWSNAGVVQSGTTYRSSLLFTYWVKLIRRLWGIPTDHIELSDSSRVARAICAVEKEGNLKHQWRRWSFLECPESCLLLRYWYRR